MMGFKLSLGNLHHPGLHSILAFWATCVGTHCFLVLGDFHSGGVPHYHGEHVADLLHLCSQ